MAEYIELFFVPLLLLIVVVVPLWIVFHYVFTKSTKLRLSKEERKQLETLKIQAEEMAERLANLEAILDAQAPDWRS